MPDPSPSPLGAAAVGPVTGRVRADVLVGVAVAVAVSLLGVAVGLLWSVLAPRADLVRSATGIDYADSETKDFITADAYLFLLCLAAGVLAALLVWWLAGRRGLGTLVGLVVGAGVGAYVASKVGVHGSSRAQVLAAARAGSLPDTFDLPLQLHARTVLLALPGAASLTWAALVLRTPAPPRPQPAPPTGEPVAQVPGSPLSSG